MDDEVIEGGKISPPVFDLANAKWPPNSVACSSSGDIYLIGENSTIFFSISKSAENCQNKDRLPKFKKLEIANFAQPVPNFSQLCFNASETILLIWEPKCLGVLFASNRSINSFNYHGENQNELQFTLAGEEFLEEPDSCILQAQWHPLSDYHVVFLLNTGVVAVINVVTGATQDITLPSSLPFVSFTFGTGSGWLRFSILLLTNDGRLYVLCPIIPSGCIVNNAIVEDLWSWLEYHMSLESESNAPFRGLSDQELQLVNKYLTAGFGPPNSIPPHTSNTSFAERKPASEKVTYFGAYAAKEQQERNSTLYRILEATPLLQGPFHVSLPSKSNSNRNTRTSIDLSIYGQVSDLLICPHHHCSAPVVAVSYAGGGVLLLLLDGEVRIAWTCVFAQN